jgi:uncharacterized protein YqeY
VTQDASGLGDGLDAFEPLDGLEEGITNQDLAEEIVEDFLSDLDAADEVNDSVADAIQELESEDSLADSGQIVKEIIAALK